MEHSMLPTFSFFDVRATDANNVGTEWLKWVRRFENFVVACGITSDARKTALLLHYIGEEVHDIYCVLPEPPATAPAATASAVLSTAGESPLHTAARKKLDAYFAPRVNTTFEVYHFRQARQVEGEPLDSFYAKLRQLVRHCAFADPDTEIKNQILLSTTSSRLRRYAMQHDLDLEGILKQGRLFEEVEHNVTLMEQGSQQQPSENTVAAIAANAKLSSHHHPSKRHQKTSSQPRENSRRQHPDASCYNCGGSWPHNGGRSSCPARGKSCRSCQKVGHFSKVCRSAPVTVRAIRKNAGSDSDGYTFATDTSCDISRSPRVIVEVNGTPVEFTLDTGATVSTVGSSDLWKLRLRHSLEQTGVKRFAYGATSPLPVLGKLSVTMKYKAQEGTDEIFVINGDHPALLSFSAASRLGLVQITYNVEDTLIENNIQQQYPQLFTGVECLRDQQVRLHVDDSVPPVAQPHRRIPFAMRKPLEAELSRLLALDIIEETEGPTPWVSPVVLVP